MKTSYIINSIALGRSATAWRAIESHIKRASSASSEVRITQSGGQAISLTKDAIESGCDTVVAVGGDGTVNEVLNGLFENDALINKDVVLGIVPVGSGRCHTPAFSG